MRLSLSLSLSPSLCARDPSARSRRHRRRFLPSACNDADCGRTDGRRRTFGDDETWPAQAPPRNTSRAHCVNVSPGTAAAVDDDELTSFRTRRAQYATGNIGPSADRRPAVPQVRPFRLTPERTVKVTVSTQSHIGRDIFTDCVSGKRTAVGRSSVPFIGPIPWGHSGPL